MAATDKEKRHPFFRRRAPSALALIAFAILTLGYQNCAVDLASTTPGASVSACQPSAQALTDFEPVLNQILQAKGNISGTSKSACGNCHGTTGTDAFASVARGVFIIEDGDTTANPALVKTNLCTIEGRASMLENKVINGPHTGGTYTSSEVQILVDFLNTYY